MIFFERLKTLRESNCLTQKQVSENIGMSETAYQKYEYGKREPAYKYLLALADCFNVSIDFLVGRTENPEISK